jgi:hypothetical protein
MEGAGAGADQISELQWLLDLLGRWVQQQGLRRWMPCALLDALPAPPARSPPPLCTTQTTSKTSRVPAASVTKQQRRPPTLRGVGEGTTPVVKGAVYTLPPLITTRVLCLKYCKKQQQLQQDSSTSTPPQAEEGL